MYGALAAAAVVALAVALPWQLGREARDVSALHQELTQVLGSTRYTESRLSGFEHGALRGPMRSAAGKPPLPPEVDFLTARIEMFGESHDSPQTQHLLGVSRLVSSDYDGAITALESASKRLRKDATTFNDLAAAYIARGTARSRNDDLNKGVDAARRAYTFDPELRSAYFNESLALSRLVISGDTSRLREARIAWSRYFRLDPNSPWATEGRRLLDDINELHPQQR
jgi:tetratricopeptide (TPR) repeat protein